jgi:hypothetical protein
MKKKFLKIPMSDINISRCIQDMSQDVKTQVTAHINEADFFCAVKLNEATDIIGKAQLVAFSRFVCKEDIIEQFLLFKPLPERTKARTF